MESQGQGLKTACLGTQFSPQCHLRNEDSSSGVLFDYFTDLLTWVTYFVPRVETGLYYTLVTAAEPSSQGQISNSGYMGSTTVAGAADRSWLVGALSRISLQHSSDRKRYRDGSLGEDSLKLSCL